MISFPFRFNPFSIHLGPHTLRTLIRISKHANICTVIRNWVGIDWNWVGIDWNWDGIDWNWDGIDWITVP